VETLFKYCKSNQFSRQKITIKLRKENNLNVLESQFSSKEKNKDTEPPSNQQAK
jgi:hypothetical protein